jgi:hypothetical protein
MLDDKELEKKAREQVEAQKGFYVHLCVYVLTNIALFAVNWASKGQNGNWWFYWPLLGWGIGLAAHGFGVFGAFGLFTRDWEERQVKRIMDKERNRPGGR